MEKTSATNANNERVGLAIMRVQPLHAGHCRILDYMIRNYKTCILGIGSVQKSRQQHDPWTFEERKEMVRNVYGDRIKIIQLMDLGTTEGTDDWIHYVMEKIHKVGLAEPTDYHTGSLADARYYSGVFYLDGVSSKMRDYKGRMLHIIDRDTNPVPPATDLRTFLELRSDEWKKWVPAVNWKLVEENFPDEFRVRHD